jgi:DNA replication protein DnaC
MRFTICHEPTAASSRPQHSYLLHQHLMLQDDARAYHIGAELAELYPNRAILESADSDFDVAEYARAGQCTIEPSDSIHAQVLTIWEAQKQEIEHCIQNAWLNVSWRGHALDVLTICENSISWVIADSVSLAEAFFRAVCLWNTEVREEVLVFEDDYWRKCESTYRTIREASWDDVILPPTLKQQILDDLNSFFAARETYQQYGVPWKRGVVLIGPPGNGKTYSIKALVNLLAKPCLYIKSIDSARRHAHTNIRQVFDHARKLAPCILVLEDLDTLMNENNRSYILNELDGFAGNHGLLTLATTNYPEKLDPAILDRPSRFDRKYHLGLPAAPERRTFIARWNERLAAELRLSDLGIYQAAARSEGFSFAYLKELLISATMAWIANPQPGTMDSVLVEQVQLLRQQMTTTTPGQGAETTG